MVSLLSHNASLTHPIFKELFSSIDEVHNIILIKHEPSADRHTPKLTGVCIARHSGPMHPELRCDFLKAQKRLKRLKRLVFNVGWHFSTITFHINNSLKIDNSVCLDQNPYLGIASLNHLNCHTIFRTLGFENQCSALF